MTLTTSSMNCSRNDVVLLPIPFTDLTSRKVRPAIIVGRKGADLFLVPVSSVLFNTDFPLRTARHDAQARQRAAPRYVLMAYVAAAMLARKSASTSVLMPSSSRFSDNSRDDLGEGHRCIRVFR